MPTTFQDYYAALGVSKDASEKEIKSAFRKIAREFHHTHPGDEAAEKRFRLASEAYAVLGDSEKRRKYDELGPRWQEYEQWESAGGRGRTHLVVMGLKCNIRPFPPEISIQFWIAWRGLL